MTPAEMPLAIANVLLLAMAIVLLIPGLVLFVECIAALFPCRTSPPRSAAVRPKIDVLIPAHNEEFGIGETVKTVLAQLTSADRLIVVADNCSDDTAAIARNLGATVLERHNLEQRGKGYALDFGVKFIADHPPDVVVLVDADCLPSPGALEHISQLSAAQKRPVQAIYLVEQPPQPSGKDAISMLAFAVKNLVRPSGLDRLGMPCLLTGTGMAFPWEIIHHAPLATGNIVEDMKLGLDLAIAGSPPLFCSTAQVVGVLPQKAQAAKSQRTRWEHGHLQTLLTQVPPLLKAAVQQLRLDLLALALDLLVPPLSLLVMLWLAAMMVAIGAALLGASWVPTIILSVNGVLITIAILSGWAKYCRADLPAARLLAIPLYVLWKIPLYLAFLFKRQKAWVRTERSTDSDSI